MEENIIKNDKKLDAIKDTKTPPGAKETESKADGTDGKKTAVTYTEDEVDKKVQSECDKLRTTYSKQIKDLQEQIKKLSPVEKTQAEIEIEERLAKLEASENEIKIQKNRLELQEKLSVNGLDKTLADYLKDDVDVDKVSALVEDIVKTKMKASGYVPSDHSSDDKVTPEEFKKWSYSKKEKFAQEHPDSFKRLIGKK